MSQVCHSYEGFLWHIVLCVSIQSAGDDFCATFLLEKLIFHIYVYVQRNVFMCISYENGDSEHTRMGNITAAYYVRNMKMIFP